MHIPSEMLHGDIRHVTAAAEFAVALFIGITMSERKHKKETAA